jgi:hypothetical protein
MAALSNNITLYLGFEQSAGAFTDGSVNAFAVTNNNSVTTSVSGLVSNGAAFSGGTSNGTAPYLSLPVGVFSGITAATVVGWVKVTGGTATQYLLVYGGGTGSLSIWVKDGSSKTGITWTNGTATVTVTYGTALTASTWYHLAYTIGPGGVVVYVNGSSVATSAGMCDISQITSPTRNWIGRSSTSTDGAFQGTLDEFAVFNRILTPKEISGIYNSGTGYNQTNTGAINAILLGYAGNVQLYNLQGTLSSNTVNGIRLVRTGLEAGGTATGRRPTVGQIFPRSGQGTQRGNL